MKVFILGLLVFSATITIDQAEACSASRRTVKKYWKSKGKSGKQARKIARSYSSFCRKSKRR